ncbi:MAG TPA: PKD domain-containing protein, partial [Bacteroidales bacterium]
MVIIIILIFFGFINVYPQKEANTWYTGRFTGLDFNSGQPIILSTPFFGGEASICDSLGNFLFATNSLTIWNRNNEIMQNGEGLFGNIRQTQNAVIVKKPNSDYLYYVFTIRHYLDQPGLYYSIVDMELDNGFGAIIEKNIPVSAAWDALEMVIAVRHENGNDIWIITRKQQFEAYASFLLSSSGLSPSPVLNFSPEEPPSYLNGMMKVSYNKKYLIASYWGEGLPNNTIFDRFQVCQFNSSTGEINFMYTIKFPLYLNSEDPFSIEFSPDSKLAYLSTWADEDGLDTKYHLYQYDMSLVEDSAQFVESAILISNSGGAGLQLAPDGKIYCTTPDPVYSFYINVIHDPWKRGTACNFEENYITLNSYLYQYLTNILLDYLYRFEWDGQCQSSPFVFQSNFQPEPAFISWNFGDPSTGGDNYSNEINPQHLFSAPGEYEVSVYVRYPSNRIEQTSRIVTVEDIPHPDLGPDVVVCEGEEVVLNAGDEEGMYTWSTGTLGQNMNEITVADSGWYWVRLRQEIGCFGIDSIYVGWFPKAAINEDNLSLVPTTCGGNNGKILGLAVSGEEPLSVEWYDAGNNFLANTLDLINLPVGNYYLHILDGNGCTTVSNPYTIEDAGDIEINSVQKEDTHCGQDLGTINITANSGTPSDLLFSVDNGNSWQTGNPLFENLPAGNYFIRVKDLLGCESVFEDNPLVLENIPGPEVSSVNTTSEIDFLQNGLIDIAANANSGQVHYSIDNGTSFQTGNGLFQNLSAGTYSCVVKDDFG